MRFRGDLVEKLMQMAADHVIVAVAPSVTSNLLPAEMSMRRSFFDKVTAIPQIIPLVYLDRRLDERIVNYMGDIRGGQHFIIAIDCANKAPVLVPSGKSCLTLWDYHPKNTGLLKASQEHVIEIALSDLAHLVPGFSRQWVTDVELVRHSYSHSPYGPRSYHEIAKFTSQENGNDGVHFISDIFGGSYIECALIRAHQAVSSITNENGSSPIIVGRSALNTSRVKV